MSRIHEDIILTAAHCQPLSPATVRISGGNRNNEALRQIVGSGTPHPSCNDRSQACDYVVYKLAAPLTNVAPVLLNRNSSIPHYPEALTVIGFGSTCEGGPGSFDLRQVDAKCVPRSTCNANYRGQINKDIMFCAGVSGGGKDRCQGDSGGPIIDENWVQVG